MGQLKDLLVTGDARVIGQLHANSDWANGIHIATMNNDSSTSTAFVVNASGIISLYDGLIIYCKNTKVASASGCTLNVNGLGAKRIWLSQSNGYCTTHWSLNNSYIFIYSADIDMWVLQQGRDSTTTNATQMNYSSTIKCGSTAIVAGNIIVADSSGLYKHLKLGTAFDITWQILYANGAIAASSTSTNVYSELNIAITTTQSLTLTAYKPLYIKGTLSGTTFTPVSTTPVTQTVPSTEDGYQYIYLGYAYSTTNFRLVPEHPIYAYVDGSFGLYGSNNSSYVKKAGDTMTGDLTLGVSDNSNSPALIFQRGTLSDSYNDWKIYDSSGKLYFAQHDASSWSNVANLDTSGTLTTTKFSGQLSGTIASSTTATTQSQGDNSTKVATTAYVDKAITDLPEPMIFKGSLGTGGTITSLPTAAASNEGFTYKVITAGTYASQAAKVGDTFISTGSEWVLIPSGDEPSGTVTSVTIKATSPIAIDSSSAITTSGTRTLSHSNSGVTAGTYKSVTVNATGHVTAGTNPTTLSGYGITDAKIASGVITLGSNTITPLTSSSSLNAAKLTGTVPASCYTDTTYSAGTGLELSSTTFSAGIRWNAVTHGLTWSRICLITPTTVVEGSSGLLSVSCTRGNTVCNATFLVTSHHSSKATITELAGGNYSQFRIRGTVNANALIYIEIYDSATDIASGTAQTWHCCYVPLLSSTVTKYTEFTNGSTVPSGYTAVNDFTTTGGDASLAIKNITRSSTTFTATRQNGTTFTFTQQDNDTYPSALCATAAATAAKTASCSYYTLRANTLLHILMSSTNTAASALTLNVNGQGAKSIYINGTPSSSTNYTLPSGSYLVYYDGVNYYFRTDGKITADGILSISSTGSQVAAGDGTWKTPVSYASAGGISQDSSHKIGDLTIMESGTSVGVYIPTLILSGTSEPDPSLGSNGDVYILLDS